jgi:hypothetical protein
MFWEVIATHAKSFVESLPPMLHHKNEKKNTASMDPISKFQGFDGFPTARIKVLLQ